MIPFEAPLMDAAEIMAAEAAEQSNRTLWDGFDIDDGDCLADVARAFTTWAIHDDVSCSLARDSQGTVDGIDISIMYTCTEHQHMLCVTQWISWGDLGDDDAGAADVLTKLIEESQQLATKAAAHGLMLTPQHPNNNN